MLKGNDNNNNYYYYLLPPILCKIVSRVKSKEFSINCSRIWKRVYIIITIIDDWRVNTRIRYKVYIILAASENRRTFYYCTLINNNYQSFDSESSYYIHFTRMKSIFWFPSRSKVARIRTKCVFNNYYNCITLDWLIDGVERNKSRHCAYSRYRLKNK